MGIEDRDYMKERARERRKAEGCKIRQDKQRLKERLEKMFDVKQHQGDMWQASIHNSTFQSNPFIEITLWGKDLLSYLKPRSSKGTPYSLLELCAYAYCVVMSVMLFDFPELPAFERTACLAAPMICSLFIVRQIKIRIHQS